MSVSTCFLLLHSLSGRRENIAPDYPLTLLEGLTTITHYCLLDNKRVIMPKEHIVYSVFNQLQLFLHFVKTVAQRHFAVKRRTLVLRGLAVLFPLSSSVFVFLRSRQHPQRKERRD